MAVFMKKVNIPQKSDLINIDMTGSGTAQTYRVIKNVGGSVVEVMSMSDSLTSAFGSNNTYENGTIDTYINSTWYNTLSNTAKAAIIDKTFRQDSWYSGATGNPIYQGIYSGNAYQLSLGNASFGNEITRHCYVISVQDIIDYLEVTPEMTTADTTLTNNNIWTMFWNSTPTLSVYLWLRSARAANTSSAFGVDSNYGFMYYSNGISSNIVRPAFQIDLSKIDYTFTDGRQPVELKPVSILQKSNNALSRVGMSWKIPTYPAKSDIVDIDMTGSGTSQQYRVIKNIGGSIVEVVALEHTGDSQQFASSGQTYENSTLDTYLNSTWYNTLSPTAKTAIVDKTFRQDSWNLDNSGNPDYQGKYSGDIAYPVSLGNASFGNEITRHIYAISVQDVIDYLEVTPQMTQSNTTLTYTNLWTMFWNSTTSHYGNLWLRSADVSNGSYALRVGSTYGNLDSSNTSSNYAVRPAFQIDLTKIDFTIE